MPAIGPGQKAALLEAYTATISLLPSPLRPSFIIIGGAALVLLGSPRRTEDVDFAVSGAALFAFEEGARSDPRFSQGAVAEWTYSCQGKGIEDVGVPLEFLQMGGAFAPTIKVVEAVGGGFRAGVGELVRMKARAYVGRGEDNDRGDFCFLLEKMVETGEGFEGMEVEGEDLDSMEATAAECGGRFLELLKELLGKAGY
jgi:hypothetical protein